MKKYHKIQTVFKRNPETKYKTLLEGVYSHPEFEYLADNQWDFTEKIDGTNIRILFDGNTIRFNGKTDNSQIPSTLVNKLNEQFLPLLDQFKELFNNPDETEETQVCLYGEGYGAKIQKGGGNYRADQGFVLFDVNIGGWWLSRKDVDDIAKQLKANSVPLIGFGTLHDAVEIVRKGFSSQWGDFLAEGIVARPVVELRTRRGDRLITKIKYKDFHREGG